MEALQNGTPSAYLALALRHDPYDVDRLVRAARRFADTLGGEARPSECKAAYDAFRRALAAFPEESPPERPLLGLVRCTCNAAVAYRDDNCPLHNAEPTPPRGGRWASDREYREHVEATTLSKAEYERFSRKGVLH